MFIKESEARQKYCCKFRDFNDPDNLYCWGSDCMAWVEGPYGFKDTGYCGFIAAHN